MFLFFYMVYFILITEYRNNDVTIIIKQHRYEFGVTIVRIRKRKKIQKSFCCAVSNE